ncbi:hypothetical protein EVY46_13615 [Serratia marcescens]|nr:hypothetical protein EVY46_13615 [Serratia marcescens]
MAAREPHHGIHGFTDFLRNGLNSCCVLLRITALKRVVSLRSARTLSKLLILPSALNDISAFASSSSTKRRWWWGKDSNLRSQ